MQEKHPGIRYWHRDGKIYDRAELELVEARPYYLDYQNRRRDYVNAWWRLVNWDEVERRLELAMRAQVPLTAGVGMPHHNHGTYSGDGKKAR